MMQKEFTYSNSTDSEHIKSYGQYFTPYEIAHFMCSWACKDAKSMLDPAAGNSVFLQKTRFLYPECALTGFEIDPHILSFFGNPAKATLYEKDYLLTDWDSTYDAIVCNPPYNRFQAIPNRQKIIDCIYAHTGLRYSTYTNLYLLFLIKSIYQLSKTGRMAYLIPSEFLNSDYGTPIKELLLSKRLLRAILQFQNDKDLFYHATTTCCILLIDHDPKDELLFYQISSLSQLDLITLTKSDSLASPVSYEEIHPDKKWRSYLKKEDTNTFVNLTDVSQFCEINRGIATGDNAFFCLSRSKMELAKLPSSVVVPCICRSQDVTTPIFTLKEYEALEKADKNVYLLDIKDASNDAVKQYILQGEKDGIHEKYLLSKRTPWYSMEQKKPAPIWVSSACRNGIKFIRNIAGIRSLTTFHSVYIKDDYLDDTNLIFCYFLTEIAQNILLQNRKELGNGLDKFQPGDLKTAKMLDITILTPHDRDRIKQIYQKLQTYYEPALICELEDIFSSYLSVS